MLNQLPFFHAKPLCFSDNNMVQQPNIQNIPHFLQLPGDGDVPGAGFGIARRMVVESDDGIGIVDHGCLEDFTGFDGDRVQVALAHDMEAEEFVFGVEGNDPEFLDGFAFQVEEKVQEMMAGCGGGDGKIQIVTVAGYTVLF